MRRFSTFIAAALLSGAALAAPASDASIESLLVLTRAEAMMESVSVEMEQLMRQSMQQATGNQPLSDEQRRMLDVAPREFAKVVREEMSWAKFKPLLLDIYRGVFDQTEIDGLIAFYRSPVGQSFISKMPQVMQRSMALTQAQMGPLMEKMKAAMDRTMTEVRGSKP